MTATPDTIDWTHVAKDIGWMARDSGGKVCLFVDEPVKVIARYGKGFWNNGIDFVDARAFASYVQGTCDWRDSLVQRPEGV